MILRQNFWKNKNFVTKSLNVYDFLVNDINCNYVWRCNKKNIIKNYQENIGENHLEIGPGTGYFLKDNYNIKNLFLVDINKDTLEYSQKNLKNYYKNIIKIEHNIFTTELKLNDIDSVGLNYVIHCVPGRIENNIDNLINNINNNKPIKFFGSSVVSDINLQTKISECELLFLNKFKIFNNKEDISFNLINYLEINKIKYDYKIIGNVLVFSFLI